MKKFLSKIRKFAEMKYVFSQMKQSCFLYNIVICCFFPRSFTINSFVFIDFSVIIFLLRIPLIFFDLFQHLIIIYCSFFKSKEINSFFAFSKIQMVNYKYYNLIFISGFNSQLIKLSSFQFFNKVSFYDFNFYNKLKEF